MGDAEAAPQPRLYVLLYTGTALLDRCIQWFERLRYPAAAARYNHAAILLHTVAGYLLAEEQAHGPEYQTGTDALKRAAQAAAYSVVPATVTQQAGIVAYLDSIKGTPYGYAQLVEDGIAMITGVRERFPLGRGAVCSEMVAEALLVPRVVAPPVGIDVRTITPPDLTTWPVVVTAGPPPLGA